MKKHVAMSSWLILFSQFFTVSSFGSAPVIRLAAPPSSARSGEKYVVWKGSPAALKIQRGETRRFSWTGSVPVEWLQIDALASDEPVTVNIRWDDDSDSTYTNTVHRIDPPLQVDIDKAIRSFTLEIPFEKGDKATDYVKVYKIMLRIP